MIGYYIALKKAKAINETCALSKWQIATILPAGNNAQSQVEAFFAQLVHEILESSRGEYSG
jgi:hypothetical protein